MVQGNLIKIIVAENQKLVKEGLIQLLAAVQYFIVIDEAEDGAELISKCKKNPPDIVLLDIALNDPDAISTIENIKSENKRIKTILMSNVEDHQICKNKIWGLTNGIISKSICLNELSLAIKSVMLGGVFLFRHSQKPPKEEIKTTEKTVELDGLTKRENEILYCLARGLTSKEIADKLFLSTRTIDSHRSKIIQKYNLHSSSELVHFAHEVLNNDNQNGNKN